MSAVSECSSADWLHEKLHSGGKAGEILKQFDVGMDYPEHPSLQQLQLWLSKFVRSIHWFEWALKEKIISIEELLDFEKDSTVHIASSISAFLQSLLKSQDFVHQFRDLTPGEEEKLQKLRREAVTHLLKLSNQILNSQTGSGESERLALHTFIAPDRSRGFQELLCLVLLRPRQLGFVLSEPQRAQDLAKLATRVLKRLTQISSVLKSEMIESLRVAVRSGDPAYDLNNLRFSLKNSGKFEALSLEDATSLVKGYQQLHQGGILQAVLGKLDAEDLGDKLLVKVYHIEQECPPSFKPIAEEIVGLAMALGVKITRLVELILNEQPIATNRNLTAGEVFYMNFRTPIVHQVKFFYKDCLRYLLEAAVEKQAARMLLLELLEDYLKPSGIGGSITKGSFLQEFLQHVAVLAPLCKAGSSLPLRQFVLEIFYKLLRLDTGNNVVLTGSNPSFNFIVETFLSFLRCSSEEGTSSSFGSSASFTLKSASMSLLPFFFSANVPSEVQKDLTRILTGIVTGHLLVREADIPRGSTQQSNYIQLLNRLLGAISVSHSLELLEVVFPLLQTPNKVSSRAVSEAVEVFAESLGDGREAAFNLCLTVIKDSRKSSKLRRAILDVVLGAFVNSASAEFVTVWYSQHINEFLYVLQESSSILNAEKEFEDLFNKTCHFGFVELLYQKSDINLIKQTIDPVVSSGDLIKQAVYASHGTDKTENKMFSENLSTWRELHAAAYNCLVAIVLCTRDSEKFINGFLFSEKQYSLWRHLVDLSKVYDDMPVETSQLSRASQTIKGMRADRKIRRAKAGGTMSQMAATISSQYVIGASLSQEPAVINTFVGGQRKEATASASLGEGLLLDEASPSTQANVDATEQGQFLGISSGRESKNMAESWAYRCYAKMDDIRHNLSSTALRFGGMSALLLAHNCRLCVAIWTYYVDEF